MYGAEHETCRIPWPPSYLRCDCQHSRIPQTFLSFLTVGLFTDLDRRRVLDRADEKVEEIGGNNARWQRAIVAASLLRELLWAGKRLVRLRRICTKVYTFDTFGSVRRLSNDRDFVRSAEHLLLMLL